MELYKLKCLTYLTDSPEKQQRVTKKRKFAYRKVDSTELIEFKVATEEEVEKARVKKNEADIARKNAELKRKADMAAQLKKDLKDLEIQDKLKADAKKLAATAATVKEGLSKQKDSLHSKTSSHTHPGASLVTEKASQASSKQVHPTKDAGNGSRTLSGLAKLFSEV